MGKHIFQSCAANRGVTALVMILIITLAFVSGLILAPYLLDIVLVTGHTEQSSEAFIEDEILAAYDDALVKIYEETVPSVVKLDITRPGSDTGLGSGFVWDKAGHIVTNFHVVSGAERIAVTFVDGTSVEAEVLDTHPLADLAVLKVDLPPAELQPVTLGDSTNLKVGQLTLAIGTPFGHDFTMTRGIISAVGRTIRTCESCYPIPDTIQTDTPINPGNSGGPLFNQRGELIGINTMVVSLSDSNTGISFAISSDVAKQIVPYIIDGSD